MLFLKKWSLKIKNVIKLTYDGNLVNFIKYNDHLDEVRKYQKTIAELRDDVNHRDNSLKNKNLILKEAGIDPSILKNMQNQLNKKIDSISSLHDKIRKQKADIEFFRSKCKFYYDKLLINRIE